MIKEHSQIVVVLMGLGDLAVTAGTWLGCYWLRFHSGYLTFLEKTGPPGLDYIVDVMIVTLLLTLLVFARFGLYAPRRTQSIGVELFDLLRACVVIYLVQVGISFYLTSAPISRKLEGMFLVAWPAMMILYRGSARLLMRRLRMHGKNLRTVAVVGAGRLGQKLVHALRRHPWTGYDIRYFIDDTHWESQLLGVPVRGPIEQVEALVQREPVDVVMVALPQDRAGQLADVLGALSTAMVDVHIVPDLLNYQFLGHRVQQIGSLPIVNLTHSPQSGVNGLIKRLFDVLVSIVLLVVLAPLMLLIALAVKLSSRGPVFYRQLRASLGGQEFTILKFRSMVPQAEDQSGAVWAVPDDPRTTPLGRILRKLSLDELPQLLNVLKGDMSLVGPRPERPELIERFIRQVPRYMLRHHVKAGITGWAQVNGYRGMTSLRKRIQYDLDYINRWSLGMDLYILVLTIFRGFVHPQD